MNFVVNNLLNNEHLLMTFLGSFGMSVRLLEPFDLNFLAYYKRKMIEFCCKDLADLFLENIFQSDISLVGPSVRDI